MDSDLQEQQYQHHFQGLQRQLQPQRQQMNSLTRYQSAPSSYFASFLDNTDTGRSNEMEDFLLPRPLSPETETIFARFMSSVTGGDDSLSNKFCGFPENSPLHSEFKGHVKQEADPIQQKSVYTPSSQAIYQSQSKPPLIKHQNSTSSTLERSFGAPSSMAMDFEQQQQQMKMGGGNGTSLVRHCSSPAGFLASINLDDGYEAMRHVGNFEANNPTYEDASLSSASRLNASSGLDDISLINGGYLEGFPIGSWNDSAVLSDNFASLTRSGNDDQKTLSELNLSDNQGEEATNRPPKLLARHLSLPKATLVKLMQLQDNIPCKIRAKRGMATHPRSIAERVRRTRISERMKKLQDLVPYMDKQTNTADMLDLAIEYIKDLQKQVKALTESRAKCICSIS
ncbi:hypothetical protein Nepgr_001911 [Nepenthes gracilis]|uniref:BHLH domain-containing protein n=1 Tax=Nepenthes gracilis TaxID=150966 RepID=A0AAD3P650_NEPGR|nr:hypothetical protein Nepgr_001911 [Nepenthes gracilis]